MATSSTTLPSLLQTNSLSLLLPSRPTVSPPISLVEAIQAMVRNIPDMQLHSIAARTVGLAFQPKVLLAVLTYSYATQIWAASELGKRLLADAACRAVLGNAFPAPREVRDFRKRNRAVLEQCLVAALRFLEEQKAALDRALPPDENWLTEEARRRILMAACLDSMELDDDCFAW